MTQAKKVELKQNELPEGWVASTLGEIASYIQRGKSPKYTEFSELPVVNQKCVRWHGIDREHVKYIHPDQFEKWEEKRFLQNGDLLWNSTGTGTIGRAAIVHLKEGEKLVADSHVTIVRSGEGMEPKYVHYWVMGPDVQNSIEAMQSGSTNQVELSKGAVETTPIPVAPPEQQKRIVAKIEELFSHIDAGIEALKKAKQLLKQYRQSVLKAAVTGELTKEWRKANKGKLEPATQLLERILKERRQKWEEQQLEQFKAKGKMLKDDKWKSKYKEPVQVENVAELEGLPSSWEWVCLDSLIVDGPLNGLYLPKTKYGSGFPIIRIDDFQDGYVRAYDELQKVNASKSEVETYSLQKGNLIINRVNSPTHLGKCMVVKEGYDPCLFESNMMKTELSSIVSTDYVDYYIQSKFGRSKIIRNAKWAVNQASINQQDVRNTEISLPPFEEQTEITRLVSEKFDGIDRLNNELDIQLSKAEKNKKSVLASAFSGKIIYG